jgi:hypothetical protein
VARRGAAANGRRAHGRRGRRSRRCRRRRGGRRQLDARHRGAGRGARKRRRPRNVRTGRVDEDPNHGQEHRRDDRQFDGQRYVAQAFERPLPPRRSGALRFRSAGSRRAHSTVQDRGRTAWLCLGEGGRESMLLGSHRALALLLPLVPRRTRSRAFGHGTKAQSFNASAPPMISMSSVVIAAWRARLYCKVSLLIISEAFLVAESMAVMRAPSSDAIDS